MFFFLLLFMLLKHNLTVIKGQGSDLGSHHNRKIPPCVQTRPSHHSSDQKLFVSFLHFHLLIGFTSCCSLPLLQLVSLMWDELRTSHMLLNNVFLTLVIRLKEPGNARSLHESMVVIGDAETEIMSLFKPFTCRTSAACSDLPGSPTTS